MQTSTVYKDGQRVSLDEITKLIGASQAGIYGFIVSQAVYDALRAGCKEGWQGGSSFASTPIVIDPDLPDSACDVAFTAKGWRERLRQIDKRKSNSEAK